MKTGKEKENDNAHGSGREIKQEETEKGDWPQKNTQTTKQEGA